MQTTHTTTNPLRFCHSQFVGIKVELQSSKTLNDISKRGDRLAGDVETMLPLHTDTATSHGRRTFAHDNEFVVKAKLFLLALRFLFALNAPDAAGKLS